MLSFDSNFEKKLKNVLDIPGINMTSGALKSQSTKLTSFMDLYTTFKKKIHFVFDDQPNV